VANARRGGHVQTAPRAPAPATTAAVDRRELDALRWAIQEPELMSGRLDIVLFSDPIAHSAFEALVQLPWHEALEQAEPEVSALLQRLAVEEPERGASTDDLATRVVVNLVEASSRRLLTSMLRRDDPRCAEVISLIDALVNARSLEHWDAAENVAAQLVTWIADDGDA
jgi:hypothetical protein